jgi:hypothetical protein
MLPEMMDTAAWNDVAQPSPPPAVSRRLEAAIDAGRAGMRAGTGKEAGNRSRDAGAETVGMKIDKVHGGPR